MNLKFVPAPKSVLRGLVLSLALLPLAGQARETDAVSEPFEVGDSPSGNYLSARVAEAEHDTFAASTFFREALRADPSNPELIQGAFVATLANGDMDAATALARAIVLRDPRNASARLTLTVHDFKNKTYASARTLLNAGGAGKGDLTTILLTAWSYIGSGDVKKAIAIIDSMSDPAFAVFRDFHAGLMLDVAGKTEEAGATASRRPTSATRAPCVWSTLTAAIWRAGARSTKRRRFLAASTSFNRIIRSSRPRSPTSPQAGSSNRWSRTPVAARRKSFTALAPMVWARPGSRPGDALAAIVFLRLALELTPQSGLALDTLGEAYGKLKQY